VVVGMVVAQGHANASSGEPFDGAAPKYDILAGRDAVDVGDAWFLRVSHGDHEELLVHFHVPGGFNESHLCLSGEAFDRVAHGQCPYATSTPGTEGSYDIDLGTAYLDGPLFAQLLVTGDGWGAFPGHIDPERGAFYGNVEIGEAQAANDESQDTETTDETEVVTDDTETDGNEVPGDDVNDEDDDVVDDSTDVIDDTTDTESDDPEQGEDETTENGEIVVETPGTGDADSSAGDGGDDPEVVDGTTNETEQDSDAEGDDDPTIVVVDDDQAAGSDEDVDAALTSSTNVDRPAIEVLGAVLRPSARTSLPRTGAEIPQLVALAFGLMLGGAALVRTARRQAVAA
jgi:LPXTG-motif cell wall-anchored protein